MAKTFEDGLLPVTLYADADLSSYQYYAARAGSVLDYANVANGGSDPGPIGIIQTDDADTVGDAVSIKTRGFTKAVVAACTTGGAACDIDFGHYLVAGSDGKLYYAACGLANARAWGLLSSGSAIINIDWLGSACAYSAS